MALYGLTAAEAEVAALLAAGESVAEIADKRAVQIDTIRTQLRAIFAKSDVRGQAQLVGTVLRLASAKAL